MASAFVLYGDALFRAGGDTGQLADARNAYSMAARLDWLDPDYLDRQGRTLERMAHAYPLGSREQVARLGEALALYRVAASRRPTWPYFFSGIARTKLKLGAVDGELVHALQWAWACGSWSSRVQRELLATGLAAWTLLDEDAMALMSEILERALRQQPVQAVDLALRLGRRGLVEPYAREDAYLKGLIDERAQIIARSWRGERTLVLPDEPPNAEAHPGR